MICVCPTTDCELVRSIATHQRIYKWVSDDYSKPAYKLTAADFSDPHAIYLLAIDTDETLGMFALHPQNGACVEIHTCLLPCSWGERAKIAARSAAQWIWQNTRYDRIITNVPAYNRLALQFAVAGGMEQFGINYASFKKDGKLHDQIMLGISRPEGVLCR